MTVIEQLPQLREPTGDDRPVGHLPDLESVYAMMRGERPTKALCGEDLLGIEADGNYRRCEECSKLAKELGWVP